MWKRRAWTLRAKMLVFIQQLLYFCTAEVIEPNWQSLMERVNGTAAGTQSSSLLQIDEVDGSKQVNRTVDELMQDHVDFLDTCLKECMLTQAKLLKVPLGLHISSMKQVTDEHTQIHSKLMTCCTMFATWTAASLARSMSTADPDLSAGAPGAPADARPYDATRLAKLEDTLKRYEDHFSRHLRILLDRYVHVKPKDKLYVRRSC